MTLYEFGITAIAPNSENLFVTPAQYEKLKTKFKNILIVYDNDLAGIHGFLEQKWLLYQESMKQKIFLTSIKNTEGKKLKN